MAETELVQEQEIVEPNWEDIPEYGEEEQKETPSVPAEEEQIEEEVEASSEPQEEEEEVVDWEERYRNLEQSHSRRGNELYDLRQEKDQIRLERLEMQQRLAEEAQKRSQPKTEEPDPYSDDKYWDDSEREILKEYPEIVQVAKKLAQREAAQVAKKLNGEGTQFKTEVNTLKEELQQQKNYVAKQQMFGTLDNMLGSRWREVDTDPRFHKFVNGSKVFLKAMRDGDLEERAEVLKTYMDLQDSKETAPPPSPTPRQEQRRQAAQGLVKSTASRQSTENMSADELWDSIPDPE